MTRIRHFIMEEATELFVFLNNEFRTSPTIPWSAKDLCSFGGVYVNKVRSFTDKILEPGDYLRVHIEPKRFDTHWDFKKLILFQNDDFLVGSKPFGLPSIPTLDNYSENFQAQLEELVSTKLFPVHRLDHDTTGLIIYAKSKEAAKDFAKLFEHKQLAKRYQCLTKGNASLGTHIHYMEKSKRAPKTIYETDELGSNLVCELEIESADLVSSSEDFRTNTNLYHQELLEQAAYPLQKLVIRLITGRTHQIRAQLAYMGASLLGDPIYGDKARDEVFALQAYELWFNFRGQEFRFDLGDC